MGLGVAGLAGSLGSAQVLGSLQGLGTPQTRVGPVLHWPQVRGAPWPQMMGAGPDVPGLPSQVCLPGTGTKRKRRSGPVNEAEVKVLGWNFPYSLFSFLGSGLALVWGDANCDSVAVLLGSAMPVWKCWSRKALTNVAW